MPWVHLYNNATAAVLQKMNQNNPDVFTVMAQL